MMRKSAGSVQWPGALKRVNSENTPNNNRRKTVQPTSKSLLKTQERGVSMGGGGRPLAPLRTTPSSRANAEAIKTPDAKRMSVDSNKSTSKSKGRAETRPITDPAFKSQCIDKILNFLLVNKYEYQIQRRTLLNPTVKDFTNCFNFIYNRLDASYSLPNRFEEEIPRLLKLLKYPVQIPKSSLTTVGSPHTWPSVLAMLSWLVDVVEMYQNIDPVSICFPDDFSSEARLTKLKFATLVEITHYQDDEERVQCALQNYQDSIEEIEGVTPEAMKALEDEAIYLQDCAAQLAGSEEKLEKLTEHHIQLTADYQKLDNYCRELDAHLPTKKKECSSLENRMAEMSEAKKRVMDDIRELEVMKSQQGLSSEELSHYKNHATQIGAKISHFQAQGNELDSQIWNFEMQTGKTQRKLTEVVGSYNNLARSLDLPDEYVIDLMNLNDSISFWQAELYEMLRVKKKAVRQATYEMENKMINQNEENSLIEDILQEKNNEFTKLQTKMQHTNEEIRMIKEDIAMEESELQQTYDKLQQQIAELRKTCKVSVYKKETELGQAREKLQSLEQKFMEQVKAGTQFLVRVCQAILDDLEWKQMEALKYKKTVEGICKKFTTNCEKLIEKNVS